MLSLSTIKLSYQPTASLVTLWQHMNKTSIRLLAQNTNKLSSMYKSSQEISE